MNTVLRSNPECCHDNCRHSRAFAVRARAPFRLHFKVALLCTLVQLCIASSPIVAQQQSRTQQRGSQAGAEEPARMAQAIHIDHPPKLDGTLDDPAWQMASPITNFLQREPFEGQPPTEKTEVRILYDKHSMYF